MKKKEEEIAELQTSLLRLQTLLQTKESENNRLKTELQIKDAEIKRLQLELPEDKRLPNDVEPTNDKSIVKPRFIPQEVNHIGSRITDVGNEEVGSPLPPLTGLANGPLCSFKEATKLLKPFVKNLDQFENVCLFFAEDQEDSILNTDEIAAIHLYTLEWSPREDSLYFILNNAMRQRNRESLKPFFPYLRLLLNSLAKLPRYSMETVLWRGVRANLEKGYQKMKKKIWWGMSSTTLNMDALSTFLGSEGERTLFSIQTDFGVDIGKYSAFPSEAEVLLFPCITLQIVNKYSPSPGLLIIQMKECSPPSTLIADFDTLGK